jgi:long-chain acyl-CoA synthetase
MNNIEWQGADAMKNSEVLKKLINDHIKEVNKTLAPYEQLKRCQIISGHWTVESGEVTPKLSLKRKVIAERNQAVIEQIFSAGE